MIACDMPLRVLDRHKKTVKYVASGQTNSEPSLSSWVAALSRSSCNGIILADPQWLFTSTPVVRFAQTAVVSRLWGGQVKSTRSGRSFFVTKLARVDRLRQEPFAQGRH